MRLSEAAVALIRREHDGPTLWLAQWNQNWRTYTFVGGHRWPEETFRECLVRELGEELGVAKMSISPRRPSPCPVWNTQPGPRVPGRRRSTRWRCSR